MDDLLVIDDGPIRHLRLNRPEQLNTFDPTLHDAVLREIRAAEADDSVRVLALSGEGRALSAGENLRSGSGYPERYRHRLVALDIGIGPLLLHEVTTALREFPKPTVALIHGHALGAGYDYALSCDFRLATEDCNFGDPRIHRALWMAEGWSYKLPRLIPLGHVARVAYMGETMDGQVALAMGLVHRVYPAGSDLREVARDFLLQLASLDANAYAVTKRRLLRYLDAGWEVACNRP
mgnify:CR=1 FL=1